MQVFDQVPIPGRQQTGHMPQTGQMHQTGGAIISTTNLPNPSGGLADNQDMKNFAHIFLDAFDKKRNMLGAAYADNASFSMSVQVGQWTDTSKQMDKPSKDDLQNMVSRSRNLTKIAPHRKALF